MDQDIKKPELEPIDNALAILELSKEQIEKAKKAQMEEMMGWFPKELHKTEFIEDIHKLASHYFDRHLLQLADPEAENPIKKQIDDVSISIFVCEELSRILKKNFNQNRYPQVKSEIKTIDSNMIVLRSTLKKLKESYDKINLAKKDLEKQENPIE